MTTQELDQFATVQEKAVIFFKDFFPKGYFMKRSYTEGTYMTERNIEKRWVIFQVEIFQRVDGAEPILVSNGYAREEQGSSAFNEVNYFMTAQTKAEGRADSGVGILINKGIASREEVEASEALIDKARKEERVARVPKVKAPDIRASLKRLRVKFVENKSDYVIDSYKSYSDKTMLALKKYGFQEVNDKLICIKEKDEN